MGCSLTKELTKLKNHQKCFFCHFHKKNLFIIQKASISKYRCHAIRCSCPKKLFWKSFLDTILRSRSLCSVTSCIVSLVLTRHVYFSPEQPNLSSPLIFLLEFAAFSPHPSVLDFYKIEFETFFKSSWTNLIFSLFQIRFLQATQAVKIKFEID